MQLQGFFFSVSSKMIQYWEWWLTDQMGVLPLRGMWTVWRNGPTPTVAVQQRKMQSPAAQEHGLGANGQKGSRKSREKPEIPCGHQVDREPPKHLCSKQGQQNLGCNGKTTASKARRGILPLCSGIVIQIWTAGTSVSLPSTRETGTYWCESSKGPER